MHEYGVSKAGEPDELKTFCPNIKELDLSKNLLPDWCVVTEITKQLKKLSVLNLR